MISKIDAIKLSNKRFENLESKIDKRLIGPFKEYSFDSKEEKEYFELELKPQYEKAGWNVQIQYFSGDPREQREPDYWKVTFN